MIFAVTAVFIVILLVGGLRFGALKRELLARQRIVETSVNDDLSASDEALTQLLLAFDKLRAGVVVVDGDGTKSLETRLLLDIKMRGILSRLLSGHW